MLQLKGFTAEDLVCPSLRNNYQMIIIVSGRSVKCGEVTRTRAERAGTFQLEGKKASLSFLFSVERYMYFNITIHLRHF